jgi:hypothetical protein
MRITAEIRWFWPGRPPSAFAEWFTAAGASWGSASEARTRTDAYLRDHAESALGIKKRGGGDGVEIKGLISTRPTVIALAGCVCPVGLWGRWPSKLTLAEQNLIKVDKHRFMRRFRLDPASVTDVLPAESGARLSGCDAELTLLTGPDAAPWWTVGFEAFGDLEGVEEDLVATVATVAGRSPPHLSGGEATDYPGWLAARHW